MKKPESLRRHLETHIPELRSDPDRLHVRIESGAIATKPGSSLSFEWRYTLELLFTDVVNSPDTLIVPMLVWLQEHQPDLIADAERRYKTLSFEAEPIDHKSIDIVFKLELTEAVVVSKTPGGYRCEHIGEPAAPTLDAMAGWPNRV